MASGDPFMLQRINDESGDSVDSFPSPRAKKRKVKSQSGQRHDVDYSGETQLNYEIFGWEISYTDRALLVRIKTDNKGEKITNLSRVKFFTKEKMEQHATGQHWPPHDMGIKTSRSYRCDMGLIVNLNNFYDRITNIVKTFDRSDPTENPYWRQIVDCIELFNFKYAQNKESVDSWNRKSKAEDEKLTATYNNLETEQKKFISKLSTALFADLNNGEGKRWVTKLVEELMKVANISSGDMEVLVPVISDRTNTSVEVICAGKNSHEANNLFDQPYAPESIASPSSSLTSLLDEETTNKSRRLIVPDACVVLSDFPGSFPLVIELKPAHNETEGQKQNLQQMMSKLFFQDIVFGITITSISFCVQAVIKKEEIGILEFAASNVISLAEYSGDERCLCIENFNQLCRFIFNVLKWSNEYKCLLN